MYDQKNIRRRVYDALNVLMAMNIISKEKKEIKWIGLPTNSAQECQNLEVEAHNGDYFPMNCPEHISPFTYVGTPNCESFILSLGGETKAAGED